MVAWAFSLAGCGVLPGARARHFLEARESEQGAVAGMLIRSLGDAVLHGACSIQRDPVARLHGIGMEPWLGIQSTSAGIWGVAAGFVSIVLVSLLTEPLSSEAQGLVELVRSPEATGPEASKMKRCWGKIATGEERCDSPSVCCCSGSS